MVSAFSFCNAYNCDVQRTASSAPGVAMTWDSPQRRGLIVEAEERLYVGPDNGLFELVLRRAASPRSWEITWRPPALSASFHGRDLFAPVAGMLARGDRPAAMGQSTTPGGYPDWPDDLPQIIYIDHYGNALTGLRGECLPDTARLAAGGRVLAHAPTFAAVPRGRGFWYVNSNGLVEVAVNAGRADRALGLAVGTRIEILA